MLKFISVSTIFLYRESIILAINFPFAKNYLFEFSIHNDLGYNVMKYFFTIHPDCSITSLGLWLGFQIPINSIIQLWSLIFFDIWYRSFHIFDWNILNFTRDIFTNVSNVRNTFHFFRLLLLFWISSLTFWA